MLTHIPMVKAELASKKDLKISETFKIFKEFFNAQGITTSANTQLSYPIMLRGLGFPV